MRAERINRVSLSALIGLSLVALLAVVSGYFQSPQPDEGTAAHIFQIAIGLLLPTVLLFLATVDGKEPCKSAQVLTLPASILILAFSALYYLEHYR